MLCLHWTCPWSIVYTDDDYNTSNSIVWRPFILLFSFQNALPEHDTKYKVVLTVIVATFMFPFQRTTDNLYQRFHAKNQQIEFIIKKFLDHEHKHSTFLQTMLPCIILMVTGYITKVKHTQVSHQLGLDKGIMDETFMLLIAL